VGYRHDVGKSDIEGYAVGGMSPDVSQCPQWREPGERGEINFSGVLRCSSAGE
jgi:hypothetical protein